MSERLDLYVEKILSRIVVDDAQRREIEHEIREHIRLAVAEAESRVLPTHLAEEEAMRLFGEPSFLARHFKANAGMGWFIFERASLSILFGLLPLAIALSNGMSFDRVRMSLPFIVGMPLMTLLGSFWPRVEVNGGLLVRQLPFVSRRFAFDEIRKVAFEKSHLFGGRRIVLKCSGGTVRLSENAMGMRAAGLALAVLVEDKMEKKVADFLRSLRLRIRVETVTQRIVLTACWCAVFILWGFSFAALWKEGSVPWISLGALAGSLTVLRSQAIRHADSARAGLCCLSALVLLLSMVGMLYGIAAGEIIWTRRMGILFSFSIAFPLLLLWWKGTRGALVAWGATGLLAVAAAGVIVPPESTNRRETLARFPCVPMAVRVIEGERAVCGILFGGEDFSILGVIGADREPNYIRLDGGSWVFFASRQDKDILLYRSGMSMEETCLCRFRNLCDIQPVTTLPSNWYSPPAHFSRQLAWSPSGKFLLTAIRTGTEKTKRQNPGIVAVEIETGKMVRFDNSPSAFISKWLDENRFECVSISYPELLEKLKNPDAPTSIEIREFDIASGTSRLEYSHSLVLALNERLSPLPGSTQVLWSTSSDEKEGSTSNTFLVDLRNLERRDLGRMDCCSWSANAGILAYLRLCHPDENSCALTLLSPERGIIKEKVFSSQSSFLGIQISPDGKKILYFRRSESPSLIGGLLQCELWDSETGRIEKIQTIGVTQGTWFLVWGKGVFSANDTSLWQWMPDSKSVVIPVIRYPGWLSLPFAGKARLDRIWLDH
jgi:hypothetical protein